MSDRFLSWSCRCGEFAIASAPYDGLLSQLWEVFKWWRVAREKGHGHWKCKGAQGWDVR